MTSLARTLLATLTLGLTALSGCSGEPTRATDGLGTLVSPTGPDTPWSWAEAGARAGSMGAWQGPSTTPEDLSTRHGSGG